MSDGWISLHRKFLEWEWYTDLPTKSLAIHYLLKANHRPQKWRGIEIVPGQFVTSRASLAVETGLTPRQIRTAEQHLKNTGFSTIKTTNRYSIVTICNYSTYQGVDVPDRQTKRQTKRQTTDKPTTTNNKENNDNKKYSDDFEAFFEQYHLITHVKKSDKEPALKHWRKLTESERQRAITNIRSYFDSLSDPQYCKKARTYLSDKNFNDEFKPIHSIQPNPIALTL